MKLFHKIVAMVSALAVVSSMAVSSVSALTAAEATFATTFTDAEGNVITDATTLKAGDTVMVTVSTSDFINVAGVGFKLNFDGDYLTAADGDLGSGKKKYPACLDKDWYLDYVKDGLGVIGIIGEPTPGVTDSSVTLGWASDAAVTQGDIEDWECEDLTTIAKIVLTVDKDVDKALDFTYTNGYYFIDGNVSVPVVTATLAAGGEVEKTLTATVDEEIVEVVAPSGKTTYGISGVVSGGALFNTLVVTVNDNTNGREGTVDFEIGTAIDANDITFGLNIWGAPAGIDFSATAAASLN